MAGNKSKGSGAGRAGRSAAGGGLSPTQQTTLVSNARSGRTGRAFTQSDLTASQMADLNALQKQGFVKFSSTRNRNGTFNVRMRMTDKGLTAAQGIVSTRANA